MIELTPKKRDYSTGPMIVSAIAAMGKNRVIGKDNKLLWRLPQELQLFKKTTMGHHLIMGRKTFESHPPLPGRTSIVVTRNRTYQAPKGCLMAHSVDEAIELAKNKNETEVFITGGEEIYKLSMPLIQKLYLTEVDYSGDGDAFFPKINLLEWKMISENPVPASEKNSLAWNQKIYLKNE